MHADEVQELVDALAHRLRRSVAVDDPGIRLVVASRHYDDEDPSRVRAVLARDATRETARYLLGHGITEETGPVAIPGEPELELRPRLCFPVRRDGQLLGFLWLIDDGTLTPQEAEDAARCARDIGVLLYGRSLHAERTGAHRAGLLHELLAASEPAVLRAEQDLRSEGLLDADDRVCIAVFESGGGGGGARPTGQLARHVERFGRELPHHRMLLLPRGRRLVVLIAAPGPEEADGLAAELGSAVAEFCGGTGHAPVVGVGETTEPCRAVHSYDQARLALRAAVALPHLGPAVTWRDLGVYGQLLQAVGEKPDKLAYPPGVRRLLTDDQGGTLAHTAEVFLDEAGNTAATAARLHIHRSTLYYRLRRLSEVTGLDTASGADRLTLHLGLKLARLDGRLSLPLPHT